MTACTQQHVGARWHGPGRCAPRAANFCARTLPCAAVVTRAPDEMDHGEHARNTAAAELGAGSRVQRAPKSGSGPASARADVPCGHELFRHVAMTGMIMAAFVVSMCYIVRFAGDGARIRFEDMLGMRGGWGDI